MQRLSDAIDTFRADHLEDLCMSHNHFRLCNKAGFVVVKWLPLCGATYHTWKKTVLYASHLQCHAGCFLLTQIVLMRVFHSKIDLESNNVCWTRGWSANYAQALLNKEGCSDLKLCNTKVHCVHTHNCVYVACCTSWMQCKYSDNGNITPLTKETGSAAVKQTCLFIL